LPDADHAPAFWSDVATAFKDDDGVIFELFNEPFPDSNRDSAAGWQCWSSGNCSVPVSCQAQPNRCGDAGPMTYTSVGMKSLVKTVRDAGAKNLILLGGLQYSNALTQWLTYRPDDANLAAAWHVYNNNSCANPACWNGAPATVAAQVPIVATEIGQNDCGGNFISAFMQWLDDHGQSYLAWSWDVYGGTCAPPDAGSMRPSPWPLISSYATGAPKNAYGQTYHDHLLSIDNAFSDAAALDAATGADGGFGDGAVLPDATSDSTAADTATDSAGDGAAATDTAIPDTAAPDDATPDVDGPDAAVSVGGDL
jgi:hypothetical protein